MIENDVQKAPDRVETDRKFNATSGGLLLIWVGIALLLDFGWGAGLIGVGLILLAEQAARRSYSVKFDSFWVIVGTVSMISGVLMLYGIEVSLVPVLLILLGISLVASIFKGKYDSP